MSWGTMPATRTRRPVQPRFNRASRVFLIWQDPNTLRWLPVGELSNDGEDFRFFYTKGAEASERFQPFGRMTDLNAVYVGRGLFPLCANRLLPESRPEYRDFLSWVGGDEASADEVVVLWRSDGERAADRLQVVPCLELSPQSGIWSKRVTRRCAAARPGSPSRTSQTVCQPASRAASSSSRTSDRNRMRRGGAPMASAMRW